MINPTLGLIFCAVAFVAYCAFFAVGAAVDFVSARTTALFSIRKDGGAFSRVWGFFAIEAKRHFSVVLLHFKDGSREAYHSHAFFAVSWLLWGRLLEYVMVDGEIVRVITYTPSFRPIITPRSRLHMVKSQRNSFVLSFRGPWADEWIEVEGNHLITLTHGRTEVTRKAYYE